MRFGSPAHRAITCSGVSPASLSADANAARASRSTYLRAMMAIMITLCHDADDAEDGEVDVPTYARDDKDGANCATMQMMMRRWRARRTTSQ